MPSATAPSKRQVYEGGRTMAIAGTFALLVSAIVLLILTMTPGAITATRVWPVYAVVAISATARSFMRPAVFALSAFIASTVFRTTCVL